eukprot:3932299-Rhodomonas_salina.2
MCEKGYGSKNGQEKEMKRARRAGKEGSGGEKDQGVVLADFLIEVAIHCCISRVVPPHHEQPPAQPHSAAPCPPAQQRRLFPPSAPAKEDRFRVSNILHLRGSGNKAA